MRPITGFDHPSWPPHLARALAMAVKDLSDSLDKTSCLQTKSMWCRMPQLSSKPERAQLLPRVILPADIFS
jgi:hypothetical protein